ncbi:SDR family oxidoreductase [Streptomyces sp. CB02460]|uniref:SDR family oxidoreductase n=1 Tax=Streptomyces sp. CB02460 TaxID=1703941 RepID=UPI00093CE727|nr:sugar nucleotide-binding protein [Streptomyces sp. CB02460]OKJ68641.1 dTDP-4-dehydrorhamnose reductase [Streptomyces sp. CB02460]
MTVLIIGGSGLLGTELVRQAASSDGPPAATYHSRPGDPARAAWHHLDLRAPARLEQLLDTVAPTTLINATSGGADWAVTAEGAVRLALAAAERGLRLVHVSSDAVFSGAARDPYDESCLPDPLTPYGAAKAAAETAVRIVSPGAAVVRTSLIIGNGLSEHEQLVHALADGTREGALFTDDIRCPVHVGELAAALWEIARSDAAGVFHLAGPDALSRHQLGELIARRDGLDPARLPAARRGDSGLPGGIDVRLDCRATRRKLGTRLRGAREFLSEGDPA